MKNTTRSPNSTQKASHHKSTVEDDSPSSLARHMGKSLLCTVIFGAFLVLSLSLVAYFYSDPDKLILPLALLAAALTALFGGFVAVRIHGHSALFCGLCNGTLLTALMILASLFFRAYADGYSAAISCLLHLAIILLSVAGAYLGLQKKKKKPKH